MAELFKPEGLFISTTPCLAEKMANLNKFQFSLALLPSKMGLIPHVKSFRFSELDDLIANENFQIIEAEKLYHKLSSYFMVAKMI